MAAAFYFLARTFLVSYMEEEDRRAE